MTHAYLDALDALAYSRPHLEPGNYSTMASYRADQRANMRDLADYRLLRLYVAPSDAELAEAARGGRIDFVQHIHTLKDTLADRAPGVTAHYCAGQYYPREYRAACVRLLARVWWMKQAERFTGTTADQIRDYARRVCGRGIASRWFN